MPVIQDLTGKVFGKLTVIKAMPGNRQEKRTWECLCTCGRTTTVPTAALNRGTTKSCGCLKFESATFNVTHGQFVGGKATPEYTAWKNMHVRCDPFNEIYAESYFQRGIVVCERWNVFENFLADMGKKPSPIHSLDRKDNDGIYELSNCRWATPKEQANNTRKNIWIHWEGESKTLPQWAEFWGIKSKTLYNRLKRMHKL